MDKIVVKVYSFINRLDDLLQNKSNRSRSYLILAFSVFLFFLIFKLNVMTPMWVDDYFYSLSYSGGKLSSSIKDIFLAQYHHYFNWGGRSVVHFIAQFLLLCPSYVADAFNSLIFVFFVILIYYHAKGLKKEQSVSLFILIFLSIWFLLPAFAETVLWTTGSANYLWGMFIVMLFLWLIYWKKNIQNTYLGYLGIYRNCCWVLYIVVSSRQFYKSRLIK